MLYPSIDALKNKIDSKYSLVSLASKRARQMQE
ncbi:MAG TPA: DNA-directed RNA polymerase subunit omega, partial [Ureibacillus sp.]|nr:DNA-directed RNA polymerase subunit omega [Ureibacillus sp.]